MVQVVEPGLGPVVADDDSELEVRSREDRTSGGRPTTTGTLWYDV